MLQEAYAHMSSIAERHSDEIITTAFENWPPLYKEFALARPVASLPFSVDDIEMVLRGNSDRARWKQQAISIPEIAQHTIKLLGGRVFPKIGPVSWKEVPTFSIMESSDAAAMIPAMLASVTSRMAIILEAFVIGRVPTFLHFFPAIDLASHAELRIRVRDGKMVDARWQSVPSGVRPDFAIKERIINTAAKLCPSSPLPSLLLDLSVDCTNATSPARLIEINPDIAVVAAPLGRSSLS